MNIIHLLKGGFFLLTFSILSAVGSTVNGQCVLTSSDDKQSEVLACLTACGCSTVQIPDGVTIAMNGDWDLTSAGDITFEILGSGSLEFSGNGGNAESLNLNANSVLIIGDPTNTNAIVQSGGNGQIRLTIGGTNYYGNDFTTIIEAGGADVNGPLPIELLFFQIESKGGFASINWATLSELAFSHFNIEWSRDGKIFSQLARIQPENSANSTKNYTFQTESLQNGIHYFRLKATDLDGSFQYFPIKSVSINDDNEINVFPNPVDRGVKLQLKSSSKIEMVMISEINGQILSTDEPNELSEVTLETTDFSPGIYLLSIITDGKHQVKRITIR